jgi:FkbM family methyltransferase
MEFEKNKIFVQIGVNNGNDEFNQMVKDSQPSIVILVEPNKSLNEEIFHNYSGIDNVFLENVAITEINKGIVKLVIPKDTNTGVSVNGIHYEHPGFSLLPMTDWGNDFVSIESDSMTFNDLCDKYSITDIHYLQIDTEGYDTEIIKSIDFNRINIDIIKYEIWTFEEQAFSKHERANEYGLNGFNYANELLTSLGYTLTRLQHDMLAVKNNLSDEAKN